MEVLPEIALDVRGQVRIATILAEPVAVAPASALLDTEMSSLVAELARRHAGRQPSEIPGLLPARELYRTFGVDPTRTRPSSEALLRRALQGKPMPRVSNAVDVCNLCSLRFLLPIGLYDVSGIRGGATLRRGVSGESYPGIRKDEVHLEGRLVLADAHGPFGNPTSDSARTAVSASTTRLYLVVFAPTGFSADLLREHARFASDAIVRHLSTPGSLTVVRSAVVPAT